MKKDIKNTFEIKLNFDRQTQNPSRLFRSFASIIEGVNKLDYLIAESVNTTVSSSIFLDDIEKGSLIGKLYNAIIIGEDGEIDNTPNSQNINEYIEGARANTLNFIANNKSSLSDITELHKNIVSLAEKKGIKDTFNYSDIDLLNLAKSINIIKESTTQLEKNESFEVKGDNSSVKAIKNNSPKIDLNIVEKALTDKQIINESELFYLIKKPDFLGDSAWNFKHGKKAVSAKILHEEWLKSFHTGLIKIVPGDSLKVKVRQTSNYNTNGYLISEKLEIIKVIDVIHNTQK